MSVSYAEVIGDPIAHSKSPLIHKFWLERLGIEGDYRTIRVTADELPAYLASRRSDRDWRGCNVTIPHKMSVRGHLDDLHDCRVGAVNCVLPRNGRLVGENSDTEGIGAGLDFHVPTDAPVCVIGAGGGARAALATLDILAVYQFSLIARDRAQARSLLEPHGEHGKVFGFDQAEEALSGCFGAINATPLGMTGFPDMPDSVLRGLSGIRRGGFALDLVYSPLETAFLSKAKQERLKVIDGLTVLIGQARWAFQAFFGVPAPRGRDAELMKQLRQ
jgi:shikimate dehydrogenase